MQPGLLQEVISELSYLERTSSDNSPWGVLGRDGRYPEALEAIETQAGLNPVSPSSRLWWVLCQLKLGRVPVTALSAPLEEIFPTLTESPSEHALGCLAFLELASSLFERKHPRLAVMMMQRAAELGQVAKSIPARLVHGMNTGLVQSIEAELLRAREKREDKNYIKELETRLEKARAVLTDIEKPPSPVHEVKPLKKRKFFTSKAIIERANAEQDTKTTSAAQVTILPLEQARFEQPGLPSPDSEPVLRRPTRLGSRVSRGPAILLLSLVGLLTGALLLLWQLLRMEPGTEELKNRLAIAVRMPLNNELVLPETAGGGERAVAASATNLSAVNQRLKNLDLDRRDAPGAGVEQPAAQNSGQAAKGKPVEEDEIEALPEDPKPQKDARLPSVSSPKNPPAKVEQIDDSPRKTPLDGLENSQTQDNTAQVRTEDPYAGSGQRALDGTPLRSYEVERFDPPIRFRTLTPTEVFSAPSLLASSLAHLEPNTPVHVVSRMGQWLELRSRGGKRGFIYAQDAVEEKGKQD